MLYEDEKIKAVLYGNVHRMQIASGVGQISFL